MPTLESRVDDLRAVMDATDSQQAALFGFLEGGPISVLFAATHPQRVHSLILYGTLAGGPLEADGSTARARWLKLLTRIRLSIDHWGEGMTIDRAAPSLRDIAGARLVELDGVDHLPCVGDVKSITGEVEEFLTGHRHEPPIDRMLATVLFTDIVDSTRRAAELGDRRWRELLDRHDEITFAEIGSFQGWVIKQTGHGVLATFDGPTRAVLCAIALADRIPRIGIDIRIGLHTGECERRGDDIGGIAVHIAARIAALANAREVLVSSTVKDLIYGSGITFEDRGAHELKGRAR